MKASNWLIATISIFTVLVSHISAQAESPKATLERALFAEEHERDFATALTAYRGAASAAEKAGDRATVELAQKGEARVLARTKKDQEAPTTQPTGNVEQAIWNAVAQLMTATTDTWENCVRNVTIYGNLALPQIEKGLATGWTVADPSGLRAPIPAERGRLASALADIRTPEADTVIERILAGDDTLSKNWIISRLKWHVHERIIRSLIENPNPDISLAALKKAAGVKDPRLVEPMVRAAKKGFDPTISDWIRTNAFDRFTEVIGASTASISDRIWYLEKMLGSIPYDHQASGVDTATSLLSTPTMTVSDMSRIVNSLSAIFSRGGGMRAKDFSPEQRQRVEQALLGKVEAAAREEGPTLNAIFSLLELVGGSTTIAQAPNLIASVRGRAKYAIEGLARCLAAIAERLGADDVAPALAAARILVAEDEKDTSIDLSRGVQSLVETVRLNRWTPEQLIAENHGFGLAEQVYLFTILENDVAPGAEENASADAVARGRALLPMCRNVIGKERPAMRAGRAVNHVTVAIAYRDEASVPMLLGMAVRHRSNEANNGVVAPAMPFVADLVNAFPDASEKYLADCVAKCGTNDFRTDHSVAVTVIGWFPGDRAAALARKFLASSPSQAVKKCILEGILLAPAQAATRAVLVEHFASGTPFLRVLSLNQFASELNQAAIPVIGESLRDPDESVRTAARAAFQKFREYREALDEFAIWTNNAAAQKTTEAELLKLLATASDDVKIGAATALAALRNPAILPELAKAMEGASERVQKAIGEAMQKITAPAPAPRPAPAPKSDEKSPTMGADTDG